MTRALVDTHALLWWLSDDPALPAPARALLADPANELLVSAASVWEVAIKRSLGKLPASDELVELIAEEGFAFLAVSPWHAWRVSTLPHHHTDPVRPPADRPGAHRGHPGRHRRPGLRGLRGRRPLVSRE